jgi:hypothetical protein
MTKSRPFAPQGIPGDPDDRPDWTAALRHSGITGPRRLRAKTRVRRTPRLSRSRLGRTTARAATGRPPRASSAIGTCARSLRTPRGKRRRAHRAWVRRALRRRLSVQLAPWTNEARPEEARGGRIAGACEGALAGAGPWCSPSTVPRASCPGHPRSLREPRLSGLMTCETEGASILQAAIGRGRCRRCSVPAGSLAACSVVHGAPSVGACHGAALLGKEQGTSRMVTCPAEAGPTRLAHRVGMNRSSRGLRRELHRHGGPSSPAIRDPRGRHPTRPGVGCSQVESPVRSVVGTCR